MSVTGMSSLLESPLAPWHRSHGARLIPFAGWSMPVQFTSILAEHGAVRKAVGLFDLSHMGRIRIRGTGAESLLQSLLTNDLARLSVGRGQYTLMCNESGGVVDDLVVYREEDGFFMVANAANRTAVWKRLYGRAGARHGIALSDITMETCMVAVQGPLAAEIIGRLTPVEAVGLRYYRCMKAEIQGVEAFVARTGYTGEDGFEIIVGSGEGPGVWKSILQIDAPVRPQPAGLGARDLLRLEAGFPLHGSELTVDTTPLEAGLERFVRWEKGDFVGREAMEPQRQRGVGKKLIGFQMEQGPVARSGCPIGHAGHQVGWVTSGNYSPTLDKFVGMGYVETDLARLGTEVWVEVRGRRNPARIAPLPFVPHRVHRGP